MRRTTIILHRGLYRFPELTRGERLLIEVIHTLFRKEDAALTNRELAKIFGVKIQTMKNKLRSLRKKGWLKISFIDHPNLTHKTRRLFIAPEKLKEATRRHLDWMKQHGDLMKRHGDNPNE